MGKSTVDRAIKGVTQPPEVKQDPKDEFKKAVLGISQLNKEIASVAELLKTANKMAKNKAIRNIDIKQLEEDTEIYSSKHYIYGELIVKCWRDFILVKANELA